MTDITKAVDWLQLTVADRERPNLAGIWIVDIDGALLGLNVRERARVAHDGTWLNTFVRDAEGRASAPPDFEHDIRATFSALPLEVQRMVYWSHWCDSWICVLQQRSTGELLAEGEGGTDAEAAARALCELLTRQAVTT